jgi:2-methylisocitrate lyase-like PEP mutase family enzyme
LSICSEIEEPRMITPRPTLADKRRGFRALHSSGCFVIPNPYDVGSALALQGLGFKALASSSAGLAWSLGRSDGGLTRQQVMDHLAALSAATDLPINADFEDAFASSSAGVEESVALAIEVGVAGLSVEDYSGGAILSVDEATKRLRAARGAIDRSGHDVLLVGRAEGLIRGRPLLDEVIARLRAYADAGADVLFAPGLKTREDIAAVVAAVAPRPVNVVNGGAGAFTVADLAALGVRRISLGGGLARAAWGGFLKAAQLLASEGRFDGLASGTSGGELNTMFEGRSGPG